MKRRDTRRLRPQRPILAEKNGGENTSKAGLVQKMARFYICPSVEMPGLVKSSGTQKGPPRKELTGDRAAG